MRQLIETATNALEIENRHRAAFISRLDADYKAGEHQTRIRIELRITKIELLL